MAGIFGRKKTQEFSRQRLLPGKQVDNSLFNPSSVIGNLARKDDVLEPWQRTILEYADKVPIQAAAVRLYEDSARRVIFYLKDSKSGAPIEDNQDLSSVIDILNAFPDDISLAVGLRFLIGESFHSFSRETMTFVSYPAGELRMNTSKGIAERVYSNGTREFLPKDTITWRSYQQDRSDSLRASSSHKSLRDVLEALIIAYAEERAVSIRNALNTGILGISEEVFMSNDDEDTDSVGSEGSSAAIMMQKRFNMMLSAVSNDLQNASNFIVNPILTPPGGKPSDYIEHISIIPDRDKRKIKERIEMLRGDYAIGVDLPAEAITGEMGNANHWNGRIIWEQTWTNCIAPKIQSVADDAFNEIAEALGFDTTGYSVGLDNSLLLSPTDMSLAALEAYDRGLISEDAARKYSGFTVADAPNNRGSAAGGGTQGAEEELGLGRVKDSRNVIRHSFNSKKKLTKTRIGLLNKDLSSIQKDFRKDILGITNRYYESVNNNSIVAAGDDFDEQEAMIAALILFYNKLLKIFNQLVSSGYDFDTRSLSDSIARKKALDIQSIVPKASNLLRVLVERSAVTDSLDKDARYWDAIRISYKIEDALTGAPTSTSGNKNILQSDFFSDPLRESGLLSMNTWHHNEQSRPFKPHQDLDGFTWSGGDNPSELVNSDSLFGNLEYYPGDHMGCKCTIETSYFYDNLPDRG